MAGTATTASPAFWVMYYDGMTSIENYRDALNVNVLCVGETCKRLLNAYMNMADSKQTILNQGNSVIVSNGQHPPTTSSIASLQ